MKLSLPFYSILEQMWVSLATMQFDGPAMIWLQSMENQVLKMNWEELVLSLTNRLGRG